MHPNAHCIQTFYDAFAHKDWQAMQACYAQGCTFTDPAFGPLRGKHVHAMWRMLCENAQDFSLQYFDVQANDVAGSCRWEPRYRFSRTGRNVHNIIRAQFKFVDGKIMQHEDIFDLWRWSRQALGTPGLLLGWSPIVQNKVRVTALKSLHTFIGGHPEYQA